MNKSYFSWLWRLKSLHGLLLFSAHVLLCLGIGMWLWARWSGEMLNTKPYGCSSLNALCTFTYLPQLLPHIILTLFNTHRHTHTHNWNWAVCSRHRCVYVDPDATLIECKTPGVWCLFKDSRFATVPLSCPEQLVGIRESTRVITMQGRPGVCVFQQKWRFKIWSLLESAQGHMHRWWVLRPFPLSKGASRNCESEEKNLQYRPAC